jgi:hypothetical protein
MSLSTILSPVVQGQSHGGNRVPALGPARALARAPARAPAPASAKGIRGVSLRTIFSATLALNQEGFCCYFLVVIIPHTLLFVDLQKSGNVFLQVDH